MLHFYSKKFQKILNFDSSDTGRLVPVGEAPLSGTNVLLAWNNSSGNWMDNGWNNTGNWMDNGWNNTGNWMDNGWNNTGNWTDNGWSNSSDSWSDAGSSGGGCFITTACVEQMGLADDCHELQILRQYRDKLIRKDESFRGKVLEYYRKAPLIIREIEASSNSDAVYSSLYNEMICPCVKMLEEGKTEEAKALYLNYYEKLADQYLTS